VAVDVVINRREERRLIRDPRGPAGWDLARRGHNAEVMAKAMAPVLTGQLKSEITTRVGVDSLGLYVDLLSPVKAEITGNPYGVIQEFRHPYLRPALQAMRR
jgi:hypothetical protein